MIRLMNRFVSGAVALRCMLCVLAVLLCLPAALAQEAPALVISEACSDNDFVWTLDFEDYLELHNPGKESIRLSDYSLQVKKKTVRLPEVTLEAGGYYVLVCDGDYPGLSKAGFTAAILDSQGHEVDSVTVPECRNQVWLRGLGLSYQPSPGYENTAKGAGQWYSSVQGPLRINEVISANFDAYRSNERGADALEICCTGSQPVNLEEYYLSDDRDNLRKYRLPRATLRPGACQTLLCSKDTSSQNSTGFKLSSGGERLYLSNAKGEIVDVMNLPPLPLDVSYGWKDGSLGYFDQVTIGGQNTGKLLTDTAKAPVLSVASSGGHTAPFTVTISGQRPIYYTTDGSEPTASSKQYTGPLTISASTALRAVSMPQGMVASPAVTAVYRFDTADYALPCAFITVDSDYMTSNQYGLLKNPEDKDLEVPAHVTVLKEDGEVLLSRDCGFSVAGQTSRVRPNRGWKVTFRERYGAEYADAKVFDDLDITTFDSFVFRLGTTGNPVHDILGTAVGAGVMEEVLHQHYRPVNLFIRGTYYGVYYLREHVNENFVVNHLGGNEDEVDIIYNVSEAKEGSSRDWVALMEYCSTHDLSVQAHYDYVASKINVNSFIDYFIWRPYTGDTDHPNIRYVRSRAAEDSRWHIIIYDMDWAFQKRSISMDEYTYLLFQEPRHNNVVIHSLLKNAGFRQLFLERLSFHMTETFDPVRVNGLLDTLLAETAQDMPRHLKRWNITKNSWNKSIAGIRNFIGSEGKDRRTLLLQETKRFFSLDDAAMKQYFGNLPY